MRREISKQQSVCAGVVINELSWEQLRLLGDCFARLPKSIEVILIRQLSPLLPAFYQLAEGRWLAAKERELAKRDLYWAADAFQGWVHRIVFGGTSLLLMLRQWPEIDYWIGHGLHLPMFSKQVQSVFVGNVRDFITQYDQQDDGKVIEEQAKCLPSKKPFHRLFPESNLSNTMSDASQVTLISQIRSGEKIGKVVG